MKAKFNFDKTEIEITIEPGDMFDPYHIYDGPVIRQIFKVSKKEADSLKEIISVNQFFTGKDKERRDS